MNSSHSSNTGTAWAWCGKFTNCILSSLKKKVVWFKLVSWLKLCSLIKWIACPFWIEYVQKYSAGINLWKSLDSDTDNARKSKNDTVDATHKERQRYFNWSSCRTVWGSSGLLVKTSNILSLLISGQFLVTAVSLVPYISVEFRELWLLCDCRAAYVQGYLMHPCLQKILFTSRCHPQVLQIKRITNHFQYNGLKAMLIFGNAYLYVSITWENRFLRFFFQLLQLKVLPFSNSLTPLVFSRGMQQAAFCLLSWPVVSLPYLSSWLKTSQGTGYPKCIHSPLSQSNIQTPTEHREKSNTKAGHTVQI